MDDHFAHGDNNILPPNDFHIMHNITTPLACMSVLPSCLMSSPSTM